MSACREIAVSFFRSKKLTCKKFLDFEILLTFYSLAISSRPASEGTEPYERDPIAASVLVAYGPTSLADVSLRRTRSVAHHQVPPSLQSEQEERRRVESDGEESFVPNTGRHTLSTRKFRAAPRPKVSFLVFPKLLTTELCLTKALPLFSG